MKNSEHVPTKCSIRSSMSLNNLKSVAVQRHETYRSRFDVPIQMFSDCNKKFNELEFTHLFVIKYMAMYTNLRFCYKD